MLFSIIFELKKILRNYFLWGLFFLFVIIDGLFLLNMSFGINDKYEGEQAVYEKISGTVTDEKCNFIIDNFNRLQGIIDSGDYSVKGNQEGTYTGYIIGDYNLFSDLYTEFNEIFEYSEYTKSICDKSKENVLMLKETDLYEARKYSLIYNSYKGRRIESYYDDNVIQAYFSYDYSTLFMFLIMLVGLGSSLFLDNDNKMKGILGCVPYGRLKMIFTKIFAIIVYCVAIVGVFSAIDILIIQCRYGFIDGWGMKLYSIGEYRDTPLNCTVLEFFVMWFLYRVIAMVLFALITYIINYIFEKEIKTIVYSIGVYIIAIIACINTKVWINPVAMFNLQELIKSCTIRGVAGMPFFYHEIVMAGGIVSIVFLIICCVILSVIEGKRGMVCKL